MISLTSSNQIMHKKALRMSLKMVLDIKARRKIRQRRNRWQLLSNRQSRQLNLQQSPRKRRRKRRKRSIQSLLASKSPSLATCSITKQEDPSSEENALICQLLRSQNWLGRSGEVLLKIRKLPMRKRRVRQRSTILWKFSKPRPHRITHLKQLRPLFQQRRLTRSQLMFLAIQIQTAYPQLNQIEIAVIQMMNRKRLS